MRTTPQPLQGKTQQQYVQPISCVLWVSPDWHVQAASENCATMIGMDAVSKLGHPLTAVFSHQTSHDLRSNAQGLTNGGAAVHLLNVALGGHAAVDVTMTQADEWISLEFETVQAAPMLALHSEQTQRLAARLSSKQEQATLLSEGARILSVLSNFHDVVVVAGTQNSTLQIVPGNPPNSSSNTIAENVIKGGGFPTPTNLNLIADSNAEGVALHLAPDLACDVVEKLQSEMTYVPTTERQTAALNDLGVQAQMTVPISVYGQPWGYFLCLHREVRYPTAAQRSAFRLFATLFGHELARFQR